MSFLLNDIVHNKENYLYINRHRIAQLNFMVYHNTIFAEVPPKFLLISIFYELKKNGVKLIVKKNKIVKIVK